MGEEKLVKKTAHKKEYHYIDEERGIDVLSKIIYVKKNQNVIEVYPFKPKTGEQKYGKIKKMTFLGFRRIPKGFEKSVKKGYGVGNEFYPLLKYIQRNYKEVDEIVVCKKSMIRGNKIYLNIQKLNEFYYPMKTVLKIKKTLESSTIDDFILNAFGNKYAPQNKKDYYVPGMFNKIVSMYKSSERKDISDEDLDALFEILSHLPIELYESNKRKLLITREKVEKVQIEYVLAEFKKMLNLKNVSKLEEKWQSFFEEYHWIFSRLFYVPIILFRSKVYVGGKGFDRKGGKITDFLYKNALTGNLAVIEIKTHKTKLLNKKPYRGSSVFAMSEDLSGGIAQVLDQRNTLLQDFLQLKNETDEQVKAYNPKCILIIGQIKSLTEEQKASFELIRSNSKDVEIVTFDELYSKLEALREIMVGEWRGNKNGKE